MSRRLEQVNETIRFELSKLIAEISEREWGLVTVSDVQISPDLRHARVWITAASDQVIEELNQRAGEIREEIRPRLRMKHIPTFAFLADTGEVQKVEELLEKLDES